MTDKRPTHKQIADHLFMSQENWRVLRKKLNLPPHPTYDEAREQYIRHIRETASNRGGDDVTRPTLTALKVEIAKQQAIKLEMANQRYKGELLDANEVELHWNKTLMALRTKILAVPSALSPALAACKEFGEIKEILTIAMNDTLQDLADFDIDNYEYKNTTADKEQTDDQDTDAT